MNPFKKQHNIFDLTAGYRKSWSPMASRLSKQHQAVPVQDPEDEDWLRPQLLLQGALKNEHRNVWGCQSDEIWFM